jgi:transcriptional regulator with XRE-family HTH domain
MTLNRDSDRSPSPIDIGVGRRIRQRRKLMKITQERLAEALNLTFQQVQKYERGANRVSASKLYEIATVLCVPVGYFFDDLPDPAAVNGAEAAGRVANDLVTTPDGQELAALYARISRPRVRQQVLQLVRVMAEVEEA